MYHSPKVTQLMTGRLQNLCSKFDSAIFAYRPIRDALISEIPDLWESLGGFGGLESQTWNDAFQAQC